MMIRATVATLLVAGLLGACAIGPRGGRIVVPSAGPRNAQDMVTTWDARKEAETRCSWEQAGRQIGVDGKKKEKTVTPSCGDYKP